MTKSFLISIKEYWNNILISDWNLYFPLLMLLGLLIFSLIISLLFISKKEHDEAENKPKTITFRLLSSIYFGGIASMFISLITLLFLLKFTPFFALHFCQFGVLVGFILIGIITIVSYSSICKQTKNRDSILFKIPISNNFLARRFNYLRKALNTLFYVSLILLIPFLILFIENKQQHLVSIVLDNSGSMMQSLPYGIAALETAIQETPQNADYVFTTLTQVRDFDPKAETLNQYFDSIVNITSIAKLPTVTDSYTNPQELINNFRQVGDAGASPVYHGIWQNFLKSKEVVQGRDFTKKKLIIISDGIDLIYQLKIDYPQLKWYPKDIFQQKGKGEITPSEFFDGGIYCINLGETDTDYLYKDCANTIQVYDGTDQQSYFKALIDILPEMYFDYILIYIVSGILFLLVTILFIFKSTVK
jgi:hypothetical protein